MPNRKQDPNVTTPTPRAAVIVSLTILGDTGEQYAYRFAAQQAITARIGLPA